MKDRGLETKERVENAAAGMNDFAELSDWRERLLKEDTPASMRETVERLVAKAPSAAP